MIEDRSPGGRESAAALLAEVSPAALGGEGLAHLVGVTGPRGGGKSSLLSELVCSWRAAHGRSARGRPILKALGRLAARRPGAHRARSRRRRRPHPVDGRGRTARGPRRADAHGRPALACAFDVVVETVRVGQSETEIEELCDTVAVVVQPGSGDTLQFLEAGIMVGARSARDHQGGPRGRGYARPSRARGSACARWAWRRRPCWPCPRCRPHQGIDEFVGEIDAHRAGLDVHSTRVRSRRLAALSEVAAEHGEQGLRALG